FGPVKGQLGFSGCRTFGPRVKGLAEPGFHDFGIEIADNAKEQVVRMNIAAVPVDEIFAADGSDSGVLRNASIGRIRAVDELRSFAKSNLKGAVVAPGDSGVQLGLGYSYFVRPEFGVAKKLAIDFEDVIKIFLEAIPGDGNEIGATTRLDFGGEGFQMIVELIASPGFGAAGPPGLPVYLNQTDLISRLVAGTATDLSDAPDERQFVVFLEEEDHTVVELNALGHLRMKRMKRPRRDLFPVGGLSSRGWGP
ncbi:MAG TPA: hypothetical protein VKJ45_20235, partial [Blastocatellia bacterium]|nr:hypothetical protein [Blastocatellia bacterium]